MKTDYAGLTDGQLAKARRSTLKLRDNVREAIKTFDTTPDPKDPLAREKLLESHHELLAATEKELTAIDALAAKRGLIT